QAIARAQAAAANAAGLPVDQVVVHNHLIGGGFGRRLEADGVAQAVQIARHVDGPVKVVWTREEDIQHDMYRPYWFDRLSAGVDLDAGKASWGQALPKRSGRGVSLQSVFGSYLAQVAELEVSNEGAVRVRRVVCAVDCGTVVNPDTVEAQIQSGIIFGATATLYGEITVKDGRVEQT